MISFGASFGFAVMGRISLLIGRFNDLIKFSSTEYYHATIWVLIAVIAILGYASYLEKENNSQIADTDQGSVQEEE